MRALIKGIAPGLLLLATWPAAVPAQTGSEPGRGVGVVTTLNGTATVARASLPSPRALHFKDDVFAHDHIATAEKSVVRVLLGGKALITVRELSTLTIKEETGRSAVDLGSGKIAMGVARQRMRPGEVIEIRTPNAIVAVRGTVLVVELIPAGGSGYTTKVHVLHGLVEVSDPNNPGAPPTQVGTMQSWSRTDIGPFSPTTLPLLDAGPIFAGLGSAPQFTEGPSEFMATFTAREQARAVVLAEFLAPEMTGASAGGDSEPGGIAETSAAVEPGISSAPVAPVLSQAAPPAPSGGTTGPGSTGQARLSYNGQSVNTPGNLYSLGGGQTDSTTVPILEALNSSLTVGQSLMDVGPGSTFAGTTPAPLLYLDPSTLNATSMLTLGNGARFSLAGTLLQDEGGTVSFGSDLLSLSGGTRLTGTGASPLVDLVGSTANTGGGVLAVRAGGVLDLIQASAPLLSLSQRAALSTQRGLATLSGGASAQLSQLAALSASSLTIRGDALNLSGGARLAVSGDLFRIGGGSTLTIANGALLNLSGGSTLSVAGALINFLGSGNRLLITNNLCGNAGCTMIGGLPVLVRGGGSIVLNNPVLNLAGNRLEIAQGAAVITVDGARVLQGVRQGQ
jgi:hypothetical protein